MRHRVYEKLTAEEKVKCGKWIGGIVDDKPTAVASRWKQILDLLSNIIDPYYTIWTIGIVLSSPVRFILSLLLMFMSINRMFSIMLDSAY